MQGLLTAVGINNAYRKFADSTYSRNFAQKLIKFESNFLTLGLRSSGIQLTG